MTTPFAPPTRDNLAPPMQHRSYAIVRMVVTLASIGAIEPWAKSHLGWPAWVRHTLYFVGAALVRRIIPPPDWPAADVPLDEVAQDDQTPTRRPRASIAGAG